MLRSYYRFCYINEPVIFSHCVHLKLGHRFHALLKDCSDRDATAPLKGMYNIGNKWIIKLTNFSKILDILQNPAHSFLLKCFHIRETMNC